MSSGQTAIPIIIIFLFFIIIGDSRHYDTMFHIVRDCFRMGLTTAIRAIVMSIIMIIVVIEIVLRNGNRIVSLSTWPVYSIRSWKHLRW